MIIFLAAAALTVGCLFWSVIVAGLRELSMFYARNIVRVSVHFHPLKMAKLKLHRHNLSLKPLTQIPQSPLNQLGDMAEYPRKLRIVCLHGFRQNASGFKGRTASLAKKLKNIAELVFIDAPYELSFIHQPSNASSPLQSCPPPLIRELQKEVCMVGSTGFQSKH